MMRRMGWFRRETLARGEAVDGHVLRLHRAAGATLDVDLADAQTIELVRIGDANALSDEGWWAVVHAAHVVAVRADCPMVDGPLRGGVLGAAVEARNKSVVWLVSRPGAFRSADGVATLDRAAYDRLTAGAVREKVAAIADYPRID